ncbi:MAG: O-Glycosyl hydrolase [Fibrobacteres bacterium]|nr:O-Glycosyl hydrolase [Fibrobacterota bacterium]
MSSSIPGGLRAFVSALSLLGASAYGPVHADVAFDMASVTGRTGGFGCFAWAGMKAGYAEFDALAIRYVRLSRDNDSWADLQAFRAFCDQRKIKWVYTLWQAPAQYKDGSNMLTDPDGFARHWKDVVADLDAHHCRPESIDLMNEPDSKGVWSTGIAPETMNLLIHAVRRELDLAGYSDVGIAGPNLTSMSDWSGPKAYFNAMDAESVGSMTAFATHPWGDDVARQDCRGGGDCLEKTWSGFGASAKAKDPSKPLWILEYATRQYVYDGISYPDPDKVGQYNASFTMPYAVRTFENTLAFLNLGATVPFYWDAEDSPGSTKQWGYIDEHGAKKPIYHALKALYPHIPAGSSVIKAGAQDSLLYAGAYLNDTGVTLAIANDSKGARDMTVRFSHAGGTLAFDRAIAVETASRPDPSLKQADQCAVSPKALVIAGEGEEGYSLRVSLAGYSTLTVLLRRTPFTIGILRAMGGHAASPGIAAGGVEPYAGTGALRYDAAGRIRRAGAGVRAPEGAAYRENGRLGTGAAVLIP